MFRGGVGLGATGGSLSARYVARTRLKRRSGFNVGSEKGIIGKRVDKSRVGAPAEEVILIQLRARRRLNLCYLKPTL